MTKKRLDILLVERRLVESRSLAQRLVMAGQVRVNGEVELKPAVGILDSAILEVFLGPRYVSRGGEKLAAALEEFKIQVSGLICTDVGASTGGFTDCMLQNGADRVYAIDVGKGILHWKLRQDRRVLILEETNARNLQVLPEPVDLVVIDASFISLKILVPVVRNWLSTFGQIIALVKPQFEAGRNEVSRGKGVVRDPSIHKEVLLDVLQFSVDQGFQINGLIRSPLIGPKGNLEFLLWLATKECMHPSYHREDFAKLIDSVVES